MLVLTCSWRFLISNKLEQLDSNWKKILGFRNMQEKLEKGLTVELVAFVSFISVKGLQNKTEINEKLVPFLTFPACF